MNNSIVDNVGSYINYAKYCHSKVVRVFLNVQQLLILVCINTKMVCIYSHSVCYQTVVFIEQYNCRQPVQLVATSRQQV